MALRAVNLVARCVGCLAVVWMFAGVHLGCPEQRSVAATVDPILPSAEGAQDCGSVDEPASANDLGNIVEIDAANSDEANGDEEAEGPTVTIIARVTFSSGRNRVRRADGGRLERLVTEMALFQGDRITVAHGGRVTLVYAAQGDYRTVEPGAELTIEAQEETADDQELDLNRVNRAVLDALGSEADGSMAAVGGTRLPDDPRIATPIFPRQTKLMPTDTLTLRWEPSRLGAQAWRVALLHEGEEIAQTVTDDTEWTLAPDEVRLQPGRLYSWYVMPAEAGTVPEPKPFFMLLTEPEARAINRAVEANALLAIDEDDPAPRYLDARLYLTEGLFADAQATLEALYPHAPGDTGILESLRIAYAAQRFSPRQIDERITALRQAYPEFREPRNIAVHMDGPTATITFDGTDHPDAHTYRLIWRNVSESDATEHTLELPHDPAQKRYEATLQLEDPTAIYLLQLHVLDKAGEVLDFDRPIAAPRLRPVE